MSSSGMTAFAPMAAGSALTDLTVMPAAPLGGRALIIDLPSLETSPVTIEPVISALSPGETVHNVIKIPNPNYARTTAQMRLLKVVCDENGVVEPEQEWYDLHSVRNDIDAAITFGLWIDRDGDTGGCDIAAGDEWIIDEAEGSHIDDIADMLIPLGTIDPWGTLTVVISYHMDEETGDWVQSDAMTFDIEFIREEAPSEAPLRILVIPPSLRARERFPDNLPFLN